MNDFFEIPVFFLLGCIFLKGTLELRCFDTDDLELRRWFAIVRSDVCSCGHWFMPCSFNRIWSNWSRMSRTAESFESFVSVSYCSVLATKALWRSDSPCCVGVCRVGWNCTKGRRSSRNAAYKLWKSMVASWELGEGNRTENILEGPSQWANWR